MSSAAAAALADDGLTDIVIELVIHIRSNDRSAYLPTYRLQRSTSTSVAVDGYYKDDREYHSAVRMQLAHSSHTPYHPQTAASEYESMTAAERVALKLQFEDHLHQWFQQQQRNIISQARSRYCTPVRVTVQSHRLYAKYDVRVNENRIIDKQLRFDDECIGRYPGQHCTMRQAEFNKARNARMGFSIFS